MESCGFTSGLKSKKRQVDGFHCQSKDAVALVKSSCREHNDKRL